MELHRRATPFLSISLAAAALLLAGCGSANESKSLASADPAVKFQATADATCAAINNAIAAVKPANASIKEIIRYAPRNSALEHRGVLVLGKVKPPAELQATWTLILRERHKLADELDMLLRDAKKNDAGGIKALTSSKRKAHQALRLDAARLGLHDCEQVG